MNDFEYNKNELCCEGVKLKDIAKDVGTPFYVYSYETITRHFNAFDSAFSEIPHIICFAMKANSNMAVLKTLINKGSGVDTVSGGEIYRAIKAGADPQKIVYAGVGKTKKEIRYALDSGILMFNVESSQELTAINEVAGEMGKKAKVALRINPDIDPKTHAYISTGLKENKFGIAIEDAQEEFKHAVVMDNIEFVGIHKHIGSQITQTGPFVDALKKILQLADNLKKEGVDIKYLNLGGGLGITYKDEVPPHPKDLAKELMPLIKDRGYTVIFEPGRVIVGNSGALVTKVLYTKENDKKKFFIVDGGMNDLARPSLYNSYQDILTVDKKNDDNNAKADVVGPICESGDFLAKDRMLPELKTDDLIAVMSAGAYGFTMSSNYNSRPRVPEILVKGEEYYIIRKRETVEDLIKGEVVPEFLK